MPSRASGYQQYAGLTDDSSLHDGNDAQSTVTNTGASTGFELNAPAHGSVVELTGLLDFGLALPSVKNVYAIVRYKGAPTVSLQYNNTLGAGGWTAITNPTLASGTGTYQAYIIHWTLGSATAMRYLRLSLRDTDTNAAGSEVGLFEYWALDNGGSVIAEGGGSGTNYTSSPQSKLGAAPSMLLDVYRGVSSSASTRVKLGLRPDGVTLAVEVSAPRAKLGLRPASTDSLVLAGGGTAFASNPQSLLGLKPSLTQAELFVSSNLVRLGLRPSASTFLGQQPARFLWSFPQGKLGFKAARVSEVFAGVSPPTGLLGLRAASVEMTATVSAPAAKLGLLPSAFTHRTYTDAGLQAKAGFHASEVNVGLLRDSVQAKAGFKGRTVESVAFSDSVVGRFGLLGSVINVETLTSSPTGRLGLKPVSVSLRSGTVSFNSRAKVGFRPSNVGGVKFADAPSVKAGFKPSVSTLRNQVSHSQARVGFKAA